VGRPQTNGFVERFHRTVLDEFFRKAFRENFCTTVEELQKDLDKWLIYYNTQRPHQGYRSMGRSPIETIEKIPGGGQSCSARNLVVYHDVQVYAVR
jgi:hypothetical protein